MTHVPGPLDQPMPTRGPDPDTALAERTTGKRPGALTIALAALAVLAVGVLVGVVVRGSFGSSTAATTPAAARGNPPGGAGGYAGRGYGGYGGFGGGQGAQGGQGAAGGQAGGRAGNATSGKVSALSGNSFTLTTTDGSAVQVTIGADTTVTVEATGTTSGSLADGDTVTVVGTESGGKIAATAVREGTFGGFGQRPGQAGGQSGGQPNA